jgi:peptide/nickel transport system substrate-binding protein
MKSILTRIRVALAQSSVRELFILSILCIVALITSIYLIVRTSSDSLVSVPAYGGVFREGVIGSPRLINPVLATSQSDEDLTKLVYSGLLREDGAGGYVLDMAESYTISEDGLTYTVKLKPDLVFHDGTPVTAEDVLFTISLIQNQALKSPKRVAWEGVEAAQGEDARTIVFTLKTTFPAFLHNLCIGILPKNAWKDLSIADIALTDLNLYPIGSGPYKLTKVEKSSGIPKKFTLSAHNNFALGRNYIDRFEITVFPNQTELLSALKKGDIDAVAGISAATAKTITGEEYKQTEIIHSTLPRIYALFINQSKSEALLSADVRHALDMAIDKNQIVTEALSGYATVVNGPVPTLLSETSTGVPSAPEAAMLMSAPEAPSAAELLDKAGYTINPETGFREKKDKKGTITKLSFTITTTGSIEEFKTVAYLIKDAWEKVGVQVDIKIFELGDLNQTVIKNRDYEILLYGTIVETDSDLYAFWHSSQRKDPGLNLSLYANTKVDAALTDIRTAIDPEKREKAFATLTSEIQKDIPAIFLYSPYFIDSIGMVRNPEDRFNLTTSWFIEQDRIWNFINGIETLKKIQQFIH